MVTSLIGELNLMKISGTSQCNKDSLQKLIYNKDTQYLISFLEIEFEDEKFLN